MVVVEAYNAATSLTSLLERIPIEEMIRKQRTTGNSPAKYYTVLGSLLILYPTPGSSETLRAYVVNRPGAVTVSSDSFSIIPREYHKALEYYCLWQGGEYDDHRPSQYGERYRALYEKRLAEIKKEQRHLGGKRLAPIVPGRRYKRLLPDPPSQDVW